MKSLIPKYLDRYALASAWPVPDQGSSWKHLLIIPARAEDQALTEALRSLSHCCAENILVVLMINSPKEAESKEFQVNAACIQNLISKLALVWQKDQFYFLRSENFDVFLADFGSRPEVCLEVSNVGVARRMAADFAVRLYNQDRLEEAWIYSTDADALLPRNYFSFSKLETVSAYHYPYRHFDFENEELKKAADLYEIYLRYHRLGLADAQSPYAHPSIGSCLCLNLFRYVQVRGFPKRAAGEDFYLLNKIRKLGPIQWAPTDPILLRARQKIRTPFGTSASLGKILEDSSFRIFNPQIYKALRDFRAELSTYADSLGAASKNLRSLNDSQLRLALSNFKSREAREHHLQHYFDAFRELRWIHEASKKDYPKLPWDQALQKASFLPELSSTEPENCLNLLRSLDENLSLDPLEIQLKVG